MGNSVSIHSNASLAHQQHYAEALAEGFITNGYDCEVTTAKTSSADLHVCLGPHYALKENAGKQVFYLDRGYWDDPNQVSLHWWNGEKMFDWDEKPPRPNPGLKPEKTGDRTIVLCDYGMKWDGPEDVRRHPAEVKPQESLEECLSRYDRAIGRCSTALVDAAIQGLQIKALAYSAASGLIYGRENWINCLAWHNWSRDEIASGEALRNYGLFNLT